jgi:hypothetical protein
MNRFEIAGIIGLVLAPEVTLPLLILLGVGNQISKKR